jgi:5-methylcytosine-specific restriction endonuclease McrA
MPFEKNASRPVTDVLGVIPPAQGVTISSLIREIEANTERLKVDVANVTASLDRLSKAACVCPGCGQRKPVKAPACVSCRRRCACGKQKSTISLSCRACNRRLRKEASARHCEWCDAVFTRKSRGKGTGDVRRFCKRECAFAAQSAAAQARAVTEEAQRRLDHDQRRRSRAALPCNMCALPIGDQSVGRFCSERCRKVQAARDSRRLSASKKPLIQRRCKGCHVVFTPEYGDQRRAFCSHECSRRTIKRIEKRKRRAVEHGVRAENVDPFKVFHRDKWTCQLCGDRTPLRLRGSIDPKAPELDHIVPLALGGEHTYANTQCACRSCNSAKGARPLGQQRLM